MLRKTGKQRILTIALSLAMTMGCVGTAVPSSAATIKPTLSTKKVTVNVGKSKKVTVNPGSFTLKETIVNVSRAGDDLVDVDVSGNFKKITIDGEAPGSTKLTVKIKALNAKKKLKTFTRYLTVIVKGQATPTTAPVATSTPVPSTAPTATVAPTSAPSTLTVVTQADLNAAIANGNKSITIGQAATGYLVIGSGTYKDVDLTINAPNAAVTNYASFKSITIQAIKTQYLESGRDNTITLGATTPTRIVVDSAGNTVNDIQVNGVSTTNHTVEVKNGTVNVLTMSLKVKCNVIGSGSSLVRSLNLSGGSQVNVSLSGTAQVQTMAVYADSQATIGGTTSKYTTVELSGANANARVYIEDYVVERVNSTESINATTIVYNRSGSSITNYVTRANGTSYTTSIDPISTSKTTISIAVSDVQQGSTTVGFYLKYPSNLDLANTNFQFSVRKGSTGGTVMNSSKTASIDGNRPYYKLMTTSGLDAGTYYITMTTGLNYVLATTSFTVKGSGAPDFPNSYFVAGNTLGTTQLTNVDVGTLEYFVDYNATVRYPDSMNWQNFNAAKEIKIVSGQYIHVRKMNIGSQPPSAITTYQPADTQIRGETQRIAAASAIGAVVTEGNTHGNFSITNLNTSQRWYVVDGLMDTSIMKISDYINVGAGETEIRALPNYSTYQSLATQYGQTGDQLIVEINFSPCEDVRVSGRTAAAVADELKTKINYPLSGLTGNMETVNLNVTSWVVGPEGYDPAEGAVNLFCIDKFTVTQTGNYVIATDLKKGAGAITYNG